MATRRIFNHADMASNNPITAGNAMTANLASSFAPESQNKVNILSFKPLNGTPTVGATPAELFIDGLQNYRLGTFDRMTMMVKGVATYNCSVAANNTSFDITATVQNVGGVQTLLGTPVVTKPNASTAAITVGVDNTAAIQALTFTAAGVAGDTGGVWDLQLYAIVASTDIG